MNWYFIGYLAIGIVADFIWIKSSLKTFRRITAMDLLFCSILPFIWPVFVIFLIPNFFEWLQSITVYYRD